jgi:hypothetical protein
MPRPVEEYRLQVLGSSHGSKRGPSTTPTAATTSAAALCRSGPLTLRCTGLGSSRSLALATLSLSVSGLYLAHRDQKSQRASREHLSINHKNSSVVQLVEASVFGVAGIIRSEA